MFFNIGTFKNFAKFTGNNQCQSLFFNKIVRGPCNFIKKEILALVFYGDFCEIFMNTFFTEHLQTKFAKTFRF